ncbi:hypothetical protein QQP08_025767 [Theobroma cacao]|nr:hypothetical protein QQP08_025767 [Theobroma cacao]
MAKRLGCKLFVNRINSYSLSQSYHFSRPIKILKLYFHRSVLLKKFVRGRLIFVESANSQNSENDIDS